MNSPDPNSFSTVFAYLKDFWYLVVVPAGAWIWSVEKRMAEHKTRQAEIIISRDHFNKRLDSMENRLREDVKEVRQDIKDLLSKR